MVLSADNAGYLVHVILNNTGDGIVVFINSFTSLEVNIGVLSCHFNHRLFRAHSPAAEAFNIFGFYKFFNCFKLNFFNFLDFMTGSKTVKEIQKRNLTL